MQAQRRSIIAGSMSNEKRIYTVSQVNSLVKAAIAEQVPSRLIVRGQVSGWKRHTSGHCYFLLKDEDGVLPCVMWSSRFARVRFAPEDGMAVLASGYVDVFAKGGKYQFYVEKLEPAGTGALQVAFEQTVAKLRAEGLFEDRHKKPLPAYPQRIGVLTSESGAAVHDITESILNRWPCAKLFLYPVPVQGEGAAAEIAAAIQDVNRRNDRLKLDVLIVGRGGGSMEDLWAFNEEVLARAIFESRVPIISAVGHEVDTTVADLVADKRASTPTKAGVVAVPDAGEVSAILEGIKSRLTSNIESRIRLAEQGLATLLASAVFRNPLRVVSDAAQQVDELASGLAEATRKILADAQEVVSACFKQVSRIEPHRLLAKTWVELNNLINRAAVAAGATVGRHDRELADAANRLSGAMRAVLNGRRLELTAVENRLAGLDPRSVLSRGYSITTSKKTGRVVRTPDDVEIGDLILSELAGKNVIESKVTGK